MSDHWIVLIPEDPQYLPDVARHGRARDRFRELAPAADEIRVVVSDRVMFFDCGANMRQVRCPSCGNEIAIGWWRDRMDDDHGDGFALASYATPCCGTLHGLNDLTYEWPSGFARFALEAKNPDVGTLDEKSHKALEAEVGAKLRVIYRHL